MKIQDLRKLIKEEIQNVLNEATDFKSFTVLQPGEGWEEIKYSAGKSFLAFNVDKPEVTLVGSTPEEKKVFDEIAQMIGGQVQENDIFGFELSIPAAKFEELFNVQ
jgi:hypothetical protein